MGYWPLKLPFLLVRPMSLPCVALEETTRSFGVFLWCWVFFPLCVGSLEGINHFGIIWIFIVIEFVSPMESSI